MSWLKRIFGSTIGKKLVVGLTGLALVVFLIIHLAGNMQYFVGPDALNEYADGLHKLPGFVVLEVGLILIFLIHIGFTISLILDNRKAKGSKYQAAGLNTKRTSVSQTLASRMMGVSGIIVLGFLILHVIDFRVPHAEIIASEGGLSAAMDAKLGQVWRGAIYVIGSLLVGWHVFHGFQSSFRSFGYNHSKFTPWLQKIGAFLAVLFGAGFALFPIWIILNS
ncbi:MAG: succinate dehydrogenase cytochrome b subunit [Myxococcota bacterium]